MDNLRKIVVGTTRALQMLGFGLLGSWFPTHLNAVQLVRDINTTLTATEAYASGWISVGSVVLFLMDDGVRGQELWRTDGTAAGTRILKDIYPGFASSEISALTLLKGVAYFTARDSTNGRELWRTDGTTSGTYIVADVNTGAADGAAVSSDDGSIAVLNDILYFIGTNSGTGAELWRSDGTSEGTHRVADIAPGPSSSEPKKYVATASGIFFLASDGAHGEELWYSNGTSSGTHIVSDIRPGSSGADIRVQPVAAGGGVYLSADDGTHGRELWFADSVGQAARLIADLSPGALSSNFGYMSQLGSSVIVTAQILGTPSGSFNIYRVDSSGTQVLAVNVASGNPYLQPERFEPFGERLLFTLDSSYPGLELWVTDGTSSGTRRLGASVGLLSRSLIGGVQPASIVGTDGIYFFASTGGSASVTELWRTDGTESGTVRYAVLPPNFVTSDLVQLQGRIYLSAGRFGVTGEELWVTDGTANGLHELADLNPGAGDSRPAVFGAAGGRFYFVAYTSRGLRLWVSDGSSAGTHVLYDANGIYMTGSSEPNGFVSIGSRIVFQADDGIHGDALWSSDGTQGGTALVRDINPDSGTAGSMSLLTLGMKALFTQDDGIHGAELWVTDGTSTGTTLVADINSGFASSEPLGWGEQRAVMNGIAYFPADDGVHGVELWRSDGTPGGTWMVADLRPGSANGYRENAHVVNGKLLFSAYGADSEPYWWTTDGTAAGTTQVSTTTQLTAGGSTAVMNNAVYFAGLSVQGAYQGSQLWRTDGTSNGTVQVSNPGAQEISGVGNVWAVPGHIIYNYFASSIPGGSALFTSDGTSIGTHQLSPDVIHQAVSIAGGIVYFATTESDNVLRVTDGTIAGTRDIYVAAQPSFDSPDGLVVLQNQVVFTRRHPTFGNSIWRTDASGSGPFLVAVCETDKATGRRPYGFTALGNQVLFNGFTMGSGTELFGFDTRYPNTWADVTSATYQTPISIDVLANDGWFATAIEKSSVSIVTSPASGTVSVNPVSGAVTYTPNTGFSGTDQFSYKVADTAGRFSTPANVYVTTANAVGPAPGSAPTPAPSTPTLTPSQASSGGGAWDVWSLLAIAGLWLRRRSRAPFPQMPAIASGNSGRTYASSCFIPRSKLPADLH